MHAPMRRYIFLLLALLFVAGVLSAVTGRNASERSSPQADTTAHTPPPQPTLTPARTIEGIGDKTFAALVSYTDAGFEPSEMSVTNGDTVRFTNNASHDMQIVIDDAPVSTDAKQCASGGYGTCIALPPGEYWEFTFAAAGDWRFHAHTHADETGVIHVQ